MNVFWVLIRWLRSSFWLSTGHQKYQDRVKGRMGWKSSPNFNTQWTGDRVRWSFSSHWYNQSHVCNKTSVKPLKHQEWKSPGWLNLWRSPCHPPMPFCLHCSHLNIICIFCHSLQGVRGTLLYCCPTRSTGTGPWVCKRCLKWEQSCGTHCGVCWYLQVDGVKAELKYGTLSCSVQEKSSSCWTLNHPCCVVEAEHILAFSVPTACLGRWPLYWSFLWLVALTLCSDFWWLRNLKASVIENANKYATCNRSVNLTKVVEIESQLLSQVKVLGRNI